MSHNALVALFSLIMLIGVAGVFLPVLPSISMMFAAALVFGFIDKFQHLVWWELTILGLITVLSFIVDYTAGLIGAKYGGAGRMAALFGFIGLIIGLIIFPPFGGFAGLFIGVLIAEIYRHRDSIRATKAAAGSLIGSIVGIAVSFVLAVIFLILFIFFALY